MQPILGISRQQLQISRLEDKIALDNPVRFIEAFVENISLEALGFMTQTLKSEGRPSFESKLFLKIYLYGYLNGLRSSRKLEKECIRNIELQWLLCGIVPNYHSISDFRKQNPSGLEKVNGEHSLIMLVYNIKRSINILGVPALISKLKKWNSPYKAKVLFLLKRSYLKPNLEHYFYQTKFVA
jgi:transposase